MIQLPNGCYCGTFSVYPKNWNGTGASIEKEWYIHYRFYDPENKAEYPKGKLRIVRGMNESKTLEGRRRETAEIIHIEMKILNEGFNPITKKGAAAIINIAEYRNNNKISETVKSNKFLR